MCGKILRAWVLGMRTSQSQREGAACASPGASRERAVFRTGGISGVDDPWIRG